MEAALRTAYEVTTGKELGTDDFHGVRGIAGLREADIHLDDRTTLKVAVACGTKNVRLMCEQALSGQSPYHLIEVMVPYITIDRRVSVRIDIPAVSYLGVRLAGVPRRLCRRRRTGQDTRRGYHPKAECCHLRCVSAPPGRLALD